MFNTRIRLMGLEVYDQKNLENMLNDAAADGWSLVKFNAFYCVLKKNKTQRKYYHVLHNYSYYTFRGFNKLNSMQRKTKEYLKEFDYNFVDSSRLFEIYESESNVPIYTDEELNDEYEIYRKKGIKRILLIESFVILLILMYAVYLSTTSLYPSLSTSIGVIKLVGIYFIITPFLVTSFILKLYYYRKGTVPKFLKWKSYKNRPFEVLIVLANIISIFLLIISPDSFRLNKINQKQFFYDIFETPEKRITVDIVNIPYIKSELKKESYDPEHFYALQNESMLLEELIVDLNGNNIYIVYSKHQLFNDLIFKEYMKYGNIDSKATRDDEITKYYNWYIYKYKGILIYSQGELDGELIDDAKQFVDKR